MVKTKDWADADGGTGAYPAGDDWCSKNHKNDNSHVGRSSSAPNHHGGR
jgi:hypothetical protein